jgi:hypothetical protein
MKRFVERQDRRQATLLPQCLDDYVAPDNPVRIIEASVDELDLRALGFAGVVPEATGRPAYHPATLLKIYIYGYLNRGTIKAWMGSTHFLMKTLEKVKTEMSLHVLAYNLKRVINILGVGPLLKALEA